jgi:glycosyltransferase involved in cell wall biosynthesis
MTARICILTSVHPPFDPRIFHKQARTLARAGYKVSLIVQHTRDQVVDGVEVMAIPKSRNRFQRVMSTFQIYRKAKALRASAYHFHDPELLPAGLMLKLTTRAKVVYDVHEDYAASLKSAHYLPGFLRPLLAGSVALLERIIYPRLDGIISATDEIGRKFNRHSHAIIIKNYPDLAGFIERHAADDNKAFQVVYAGVMTPERGLAEVVRAVAIADRNGNIRLSLFGKFVPQGFEDTLRALPGSGMVEFRGHMPPEQVWHALADADAGVVCFRPGPNHDHSMPNKLFEYMAAALPVVASDFPLWKEIIEGNQCGITVDPRFPEEIAAALRWLADHSREAREMGLRGRKAVLEKYSWEKEGSRLVDFYRSELGCDPDEVSTL